MPDCSVRIPRRNDLPPKQINFYRDIGCLMPTFTVEQAAAARAFLGWSQHELASASGLSFESVRDFEHDEQSVTTKIVDAIRAAFHAAGVDFWDIGGRVGTTIVVQRQPW